MRRKTLRRKYMNNIKQNNKQNNRTLKRKRKRNQNRRHRGGGDKSLTKSNSYFKDIYKGLKSQLGISSHTISINKLVKGILKDKTPDEQDQFIANLKHNLKKWIIKLGSDSSEDISDGHQPYIPQESNKLTTPEEPKELEDPNKPTRQEESNKPKEPKELNNLGVSSQSNPPDFSSQPPVSSQSV